MTNARVRAAVLVLCAVVIASMLLACDDKKNVDIFVNGGGTWTGISK